MSSEKPLKLEDFDFFLPEENIAHVPAKKRNESRLMVLSKGKIGILADTHFHQLNDYLHEGDLLIMNNTKVIPARLFAKKSTGGRIEFLFLHAAREEDNTTQGPAWWAMAKASRRLKVGSEIHLPGEQFATVLGRDDEGLYLVGFQEGMDVIAFLEEYGEVPLPPYIRPELVQSENKEEFTPEHSTGSEPESATTDGTFNHKERYQTVFAKFPGAVAAPTAGLHFTNEQLDALKAKGVRLAWVTLHVGPGTFLPVRVENVLEHKMHSEYYQIPQETVELWKETRAHPQGRVISVGTTSLRALEASAQNHPQDEICVESRDTEIFIYPGYRFLAIDGLITNFHLPKSTLLMLVAALHGKEPILDAYQQAVEKSYRFYSYGDSMFIADHRTAE